jgi:pimeloyl-ACP methyl ester carboxylesterase
MAEPQVVDSRRDRVEFADLGGGVRIAYEELGDRSDPTLLLVMGLGMQMLGWHEDFCEELVARGFHVVRYDNRDVGLSSKHRGDRRPNVIAGALGLSAGNSYDLGDMAGDAAGLLDHLGIERAHVTGASMGGMIAQTLAFRHRERVESLCSIMSSPGGRRVATMPRMSVLGALLSRPPSDREAYARHVARTFEKIGSPGFETDAQRLRERTLLAYDRCFSPGGTARQLAAIVASGDRTRELSSITAPTLVIHGAADKLLPSAGGVATAEAIPGARLELIDGMGHDLPVELWPHIADLIAENAARAKPRAAVA